ncbi:hypothetical protein BGZ83_008610 [Gryganskiella cystojenkinii]|nr:hypothetical protein BGZ83_008610 [Gryganskiella cystojenkinii]
MTQLGFRSSHPDPTPLQTLVQSCSCVTELGFNLVTIDMLGLRGLDTLTSRLTRLELVNAWPTPEHLHSWPSSNRVQNGLGDYVATEQQVLFPELQTLKITSATYTNATWKQQLQFFKNSPKLESLSWSLVQPYPHLLPDRAVEFLETLCDFFCQDPQDRYRHHNSNYSGGQRSCWPKLDSLRLTEVQSNGVTLLRGDPWIVPILKSCPNPLRRLTLTSTDDFEDAVSWGALQKHFPTLQVLNLTTSNNSSIAQDILSSCPQLREFRGQVLNASDVAKGYSAGASQKPAAATMTDAVAASNTALYEPLFEKMTINIEPLFPPPATNTSPPTPPTPPPRPGGMQTQKAPQRAARFRAPPQPWVCHRLEVLRVTIQRTMKMEDQDPLKIDHPIFEQLSQLKELRELHLCTFEKSKILGLDPRIPLGMTHPANMDHQRRFSGTYSTAEKIRREPVGQRLLEVWPGLTSCRWHM